MILKSYQIQKNNITFLKHNMFLLYGENYGLKKEIKEFIIKKIKKEKNNLEIISLYENDIIENKDIFYNSAYSASLFGDTKVITINESSDKIISLIEDVYEKSPSDLFIIVLSDVLDKKSKLRNFFEKEKKIFCIPCYLDNIRDLETVAIKNLNENNISLSREVINLLIQKSNNDRNNLLNEIEKIKSFSLNKKKLDINQVKTLINFSGEHKSDDLINECLSGNISEYKKILSELYMNTINQIFFLRILSNKVQKLLKMKKIEKDYSNIDNLIDSLKPAIFWKDKPVVKKQLSIWNFNELKKIIIEINKTELLCKKNPQSSQIIFFNFFTNLCKKANNYL